MQWLCQGWEDGKIFGSPLFAPVTGITAKPPRFGYIGMANERGGRMKHDRFTKTEGLLTPVADIGFARVVQLSLAAGRALEGA